MRDDVLEAIRRSASIPTLPHVAARFIDLTSQEDCEYEDLVELLGSDGGAVSEILRIANSALFGLSRKIGSLKQALTLLGLSKVRCLLLSRFLVERMDKMSCSGIDPIYYWQRSLFRAALTTRFCENVDMALHEEAFAAGLLADVGVLVLANACSQQYETVAREYQPMHSELWVAREAHRLGIGHAEISAMVLEEWKLPQSIVEAVRHHHDQLTWSPSMSSGDQLACLVGAAGNVAPMLCELPDPGKIETLCSRARQQAGLEPKPFVHAILDIEEEIEDLAVVLNITMKAHHLHDSLSDQLAEQLSPD